MRFKKKTTNQKDFAKPIVIRYKISYNLLIINKRELKDKGAFSMTVQLYTSSSNASSRKARAWFADHDIPFTERNIIAQPLTPDEVKRLLRLTENGSEDIVSTRAKIFKQLHLNLDEISTSQLIQLISEHPDLLKRPIMFDDKRLQVGYNDEEIRRFLPRSTRKLEMMKVRQQLAI